jgi:signal transduction histidine kinase/AmiR/NasT family two-component response regulator
MPGQIITNGELEESAGDLYEHAPCGYLSIIPGGLIAKMNHTLLSWLGYAAEEVVGRQRFVELLSLPSRVFYETHLAPLLHMQGFANEVAVNLVCRNGSSVPMLLNAAQKARSDGTVFFTRIALFSMQSRRSYERELLLERRKAEQAAQLKADFLAAASHEIRNYLHSIAAVTELCVADKTGAQHERYTASLEASSSGLLNLVSDVLDYSKLEAGKMALEERPFPVREWLEGVVRGWRAKAELKGVMLRVDVAPSVPASAVGDSMKLGQVLTNLVGNAIKFTSHGAVTLAVRLHDVGAAIAPRVRLQFSVSDTGVGIPADQLAAVLEEFRQVRGKNVGRLEGTGLGLTICQRLLELYGEKLRVSSESGRGATFSFELTLGVPAPCAAGTEGQVDDPKQERVLSGLKVLVAEETEVDALLLTRLLEPWGVVVSRVDSGAAAVERVKAQQFDLVLMDLLLPGLDGLNATRAIRQLNGPESDDLPIIALAGSVEPGQRERLHGAGFTDCLGRPFESDSLLRSVFVHASIHRALRLRPAARVQKQSS